MPARSAPRDRALHPARTSQWRLARERHRAGLSADLQTGLADWRSGAAALPEGHRRPGVSGGWALTQQSPRPGPRRSTRQTSPGSARPRTRRSRSTVRPGLGGRPLLHAQSARQDPVPEAAGRREARGSGRRRACRPATWPPDRPGRRPGRAPARPRHPPPARALRPAPRSTRCP